jgi:hypothetical protein
VNARKAQATSIKEIADLGFGPLASHLRKALSVDQKKKETRHNVEIAA